MKRLFGFSAMLLTAFALCFSFTFGTMTLAPSIAKAQESVSVEAQKVEASKEVSKSSEASLVATDPADQGNADTLPEVSNDDLFSLLMTSLGGLKGAGTLAIAFVVSKLLLFFILSPLFQSIFPKLENGGVKLLIALGVNLVVGVLGLMVNTKLDLGMALLHSSTLALASVFANQAYKQFFAKAKA